MSTNKNNISKPVVGIAPCYFPREHRLWLMAKEAYSNCVWEAGGVPVILTYPNSHGTVAEATKAIDALLMIGGPDLPVDYYGGSTYDLNGEQPMHTNRVEFDRQIFQSFLGTDKPILGICAGLQHINVIFGGTLYEDIPSQLPGHIDHGAYKGNVAIHPVEVDGNSLLGDIIDVRDIPVNSTHHQGIRKLGENLKPTAWSSDGLIEAVEPVNGEGKFVAVQWHPELMQEDKRQIGLFRWMVEEAKN